MRVTAAVIAGTTGIAHASVAPPVDLAQADLPVSLAPHIDSWRGSPESTPANSDAPPIDIEWQRGVQPLEVDANTTLWLRFRLRLEGNDTGDWLLTLPTTAVENALFLGPFDAAGHTSQPPLRTGLYHAYASRPLGHERLVFPIPLTQPGVYTVFLRLDSGIRLTVDPELWRPAEYLADRKHKTLFDGLCYGILLTLLVYNLVLAGVFRSQAYLFYVLTCASALLTLSTYNGHAAHYLWPDTPWLIRHSYTFAPALWVIFSALFARAFLSLRCAMPRADKAVLAYAVAAGATLVIGLADYSQLAQTLTELLVLSGVLLMSAMAFMLWRRGYKPALWYLGAQFALFISAILVVLVNWGLLYSPFLRANALQLGVSMEMIVFAVALSARINRVQTEKAELGRRAAHLALAASTDPLTNVANRNGLAQAAEHLLQQPGEHALLLVDLDHFKTINDQHGHEAGDFALARTARRLEEHVRNSDVVARLGGDEFVILLANRPDKKQLGTMLRRLGSALAQPIAYREELLSISASVGVACYPEHGDTFDELQRVADRAMYHAKQAGIAFSFPAGDGGEVTS